MDSDVPEVLWWAGERVFVKHLSEYRARSTPFKVVLGDITEDYFKPKHVDGDPKPKHILRFGNFVKLLKANEGNRVVQDYLKSAVSNCSVWLPSRLYQQVPILLPYSIRGRTSFSERKKQAGSDNWGAANEKGFVIDDNSVLKDFIRDSPVAGGLFDGIVPSEGFSACHVWPSTTKDPKLFSFVPNIVWLPRQIARLSDDDDSFFSSYLKKCSLSIFKGVDFTNGEKGCIVRECWDLLESRSVAYEGQIDVKVPVSRLDERDNAMKNKLKESIVQLLSIVEKIEKDSTCGENLNEKLFHKRYIPSLCKIIREQPDCVAELKIWMARYLYSL